MRLGSALYVQSHSGSKWIALLQMIPAQGTCLKEYGSTLLQ